MTVGLGQTAAEGIAVDVMTPVAVCETAMLAVEMFHDVEGVAAKRVVFQGRGSRVGGKNGVHPGAAWV